LDVPLELIKKICTLQALVLDACWTLSLQHLLWERDSSLVIVIVFS